MTNDTADPAVGSEENASSPSSPSPPSSLSVLLRRIFSLSSLSTLLAAAYVYSAFSNLSNLMHPLGTVPAETLESLGDERMIYPLWDDIDGATATATSPPLGMRVYLSSKEEFDLAFLRDDPDFQSPEDEKTDAADATAILLWAEDDAVAATKKRASRSIVLLSEEGERAQQHKLSQSCRAAEGKDSCDDDESASSPSLEYAHRWLDDAVKLEREISDGGGGIVGTMQAAGGGIESTSVLLTLYTKISRGIKGAVDSVLNLGGNTDDGIEGGGEGSTNHDNGDDDGEERRTVRIPVGHPVWESLSTNGTAHVHVLLVRQTSGNLLSSSPDFRAATQHVVTRSRRSEALLGGVGMVKHELPNHVPHPRRLLYRDILYVVKRLFGFEWLTGGSSDSGSLVPPWNTAYHQPEAHAAYEVATEQKSVGTKHPYWKPEVRIHLVRETVGFPAELSDRMGFDVAKVDPKQKRRPGEGDSSATAMHASGYAHLPALHVDEIGLTSDKYVPLNETVTALPLRIGFQGTGGGEDGEVGLTPARYRLVNHLSRSLEAQAEMGFEQSDIDDVRRLVAETNVGLLAVTVLASVLHLLFEFLTFKSDVDFWRGNTDLTGLSVRALFLDFGSQVVLLLYLIEMESSLLMILPTAAGVLIALWKCQRGAGLVLVRAGGSDGGSKAWYNKVLGVAGLELKATRMRSAAAAAAASAKKGTEKQNSQNGDNGAEKKVDLEALTEATDKLATRLLGKYFLAPLVITYALYSLLREEHKGWYGWFITTSSSFVYAVGFVLMTPQLFLNYKLRSVAHLPWRVLGYRFVNTFIDDLFAFIVRMPTMARMSCFRDDIVFFVYLYQRWLYPVDASRPAEGGGMTETIPTSTVSPEEDNAASGEKRDRTRRGADNKKTR